MLEKDLLDICVRQRFADLRRLGALAGRVFAVALVAGGALRPRRASWHDVPARRASDEAGEQRRLRVTAAARRWPILLCRLPDRAWHERRVRVRVLKIAAGSDTQVRPRADETPDRWSNPHAVLARKRLVEPACE